MYLSRAFIFLCVLLTCDLFLGFISIGAALVSLEFFICLFEESMKSYMMLVDEFFNVSLCCMTHTLNVEC